MANAVKKTLEYLGLVDPIEEENYEEEMQYVTPARKIATRFQSNREPAPPNYNQIATFHPVQYNDAKAIAETYRMGVPVIVNLSKMNPDPAKRLIDFCAGLTLGLEGRIEKVTSKVFLLTPYSMMSTSEGNPAETGEVDTSFFH